MTNQLLIAMSKKKFINYSIPFLIKLYIILTIPKINIKLSVSEVSNFGKNV